MIYLEYGSAIGSIPYKKESTKLENVQRRATKILPEMKNKSYTEILRSLGLPSLEYRRLRSDVIQAFKIHKNIDRLDEIKLFPKPSNPARLTTKDTVSNYISHSVEQILENFVLHFESWKTGINCLWTLKTVIV